MYALSAGLHQLQRRYGASEQLLGLHAYRYKYFVDSSPRGRHCRYAHATLRMYEQDQERPVLLQYLQGLPAVPPQLLQLLEDPDEN